MNTDKIRRGWLRGLLDRRAPARATLPAPLAEAIRREVDSIAWTNEIGAHLARDIGVRQ